MKGIDLTIPQHRFMASSAVYPAFVGGYGSGKTQAAIARAIRLKYRDLGTNIAYYMPTFDLIVQMAFPRFVEIFEAARVPYRLNRADKVIDLGPKVGQIIFRTMDAPERIVAYEVAHSIADELDTLKHAKAAEVWRRIISRNRQKIPGGHPNTAGVVTTPEGFRFVYENWKKRPFDGAELIRASTHSNEANLPPGYIQSLINTYPSNLLTAYLEGEFINLAQGAVYHGFSRTLNATDAKVEPGEPLHIGMDFNVGAMAAAVHVLRGGLPYAVGELVGLRDTPDMVRAIQRRYPGHAVMAYPDASGGARKTTNASTSDVALLREAGFTVLAKPANPPVKDRVQAVNIMLDKDGERRYKINIDACPNLAESLETQAYDKNGEPDKSRGLDHIVDATGYFMYYRFPVRRPQFTTMRMEGI